MKFDLLECSPIFKTPVLFVFGDNDWQTPYVLTKEYIEKITTPIKDFKLIKHSGHSTALDNPEEFAKYLTETAYNIIFES